MALQDSEDLRQELDSERQRSKALDTQLTAVKERCSESNLISRFILDLTRLATSYSQAAVRK